MLECLIQIPSLAGDKPQSRVPSVQVVVAFRDGVHELLRRLVRAGLFAGSSPQVGSPTWKSKCLATRASILFSSLYQLAADDLCLNDIARFDGCSAEPCKEVGRSRTELACTLEGAKTLERLTA
ncbi:MAG: hypothetical protein QM765_07780 [Myxococcales bacterium]